MKGIVQVICISISLLLCSASFAKPKQISVQDANNAKFIAAVCETELQVFIPMKNASGYAEWPDGRRNTAKRADEIVAETQAACQAAEKPIKEALNGMKEKWFAKCVAEKCEPSAASNTGADDTFCDGGEVTVTNRTDHELKCTYSVKGGKAQPKTFGEGRTDEKCWKGEGGRARGYSSVLVYVPPQGEEAKYYMNLSCRLPGSKAKLGVYEHEFVDNEEPPKKDEPKKDDEVDKVEGPMQDEPPEQDEPDKESSFMFF